jgi:hypothetical protein
MGSRAVWAVLLLMAVAVATTGSASALEKDYAVIKVGHRDAEEMLPLVSPLLSPSGKAAADRRTNSLVIVDTPAAIARVRGFLAGSDKPGRPVTVRIRFGQNRSTGGASAKANARVSGDDWSAQVGDRTTDGLDVRLRGRQRRAAEMSEYFVTVMSGGTAYIWAGKEVPYTQRWGDYCRRYGHVTETVTFKTVETGFDVRPVVVGNRAHIKVTPRISSTGRGGRQEVIRFAEAATQVTAPLGQWVEIAGGSGRGSEVRHAILATGSNRRNSRLSIALKVEAR